MKEARRKHTGSNLILIFSSSVSPAIATISGTTSASAMIGERNQNRRFDEHVDLACLSSPAFCWSGKGYFVFRDGNSQ